VLQAEGSLPLRLIENVGALLVEVDSSHRKFPAGQPDAAVRLEKRIQRGRLKLTLKERTAGIIKYVFAVIHERPTGIGYQPTQAYDTLTFGESEYASSLRICPIHGD